MSETGHEVGKRRNLSAREWAEIQELWELGEVTLTELSDQYGVSRGHLSKKLQQLGSKKGDKAALVTAAAKERVSNQALAHRVDLQEKIEETRTEQYKYSSTLAKLLFAKVVQCVKKDQSVATIKDEIKAIRDALSAFEVARKDRFSILGLDKDVDLGDDLETLVIREMTNEDIEATKEAQRLLGTDGFGDLNEIDEMLEEADGSE